MLFKTNSTDKKRWNKFSKQEQRTVTGEGEHTVKLAEKELATYTQQKYEGKGRNKIDETIKR